jgi:N-acetylmuramoyl-L-alanine amidase
MTATGVPVTVLSRTETGVLVRSPCGNEVGVSAVEPMAPVTVVLDAGHGGPVDMGAHAPTGLHEANLNLTVTRAVLEQLDARDIPTAMTRTGDYAVPLSVRAEFADASGAQLFVSIHHNSPASAHSDIPGTEVFVQSTSAASARLGGLLYAEVMGALSRFDVDWTRRRDAGVLRVQREDGTDAYGLIRRPQVPTALVELGYLANPAEAALFETPEYVDAVSAGIADAIRSYLTSDLQGSGHVDTPRTMTPGRSAASQDCADPALE